MNQKKKKRAHKALGPPKGKASGGYCSTTHPNRNPAADRGRTFAKLAHKGGAKLDQIQLSLGHASIKTTERYLGVEQDLQDAPCDRLGLRLRGAQP